MGKPEATKPISIRHSDGSAGDADYGVIGPLYASYRQPEPRIAEIILTALGPARTVLNVGAGAGSYEPVNRIVTAVEPSASMRVQRPSHLAPAIDAVAEALRVELLSEEWDRKYGHLRTQPEFAGSLYLVVSHGL